MCALLRDFAIFQRDSCIIFSRYWRGPAFKKEKQFILEAYTVLVEKVISIESYHNKWLQECTAAKKNQSEKGG